VASPFAAHETYEETITDPRDGETWTVTLRELNAGDDAAIRDETVIEIELDEEGQEVERSRVPMGRLRLRAVERAIVSWTLPLALSPNAIRVLNAEIFEQIYRHVRWSSASAAEDDSPPTEPQTESSSPEPSAVDDS
jgi:hypothetical protein